MVGVHATSSLGLAWAPRSSQWAAWRRADEWVQPQQLLRPSLLRDPGLITTGPSQPVSPGKSLCPVSMAQGRLWRPESLLIQAAGACVPRGAGTGFIFTRVDNSPRFFQQKKVQTWVPPNVTCAKCFINWQRCCLRGRKPFFFGRGPKTGEKNLVFHVCFQ